MCAHVHRAHASDVGHAGACPGCPYPIGTFTAPTGSLAFPPAGQSIPVLITCDYTITTNAPIYLRFDSFTTAGGHDYVYVYDGTSASDKLLGWFSGAAPRISSSSGTLRGTVPTIQTATSGSMLIRFTSDDEPSASRPGRAASMTWSSSMATLAPTFALTIAAATAERADALGKSDGLNRCKMCARVCVGLCMCMCVCACACAWYGALACSTAILALPCACYAHVVLIVVCLARSLRKLVVYRRCGVCAGFFVCVRALVLVACVYVTSIACGFAWESLANAIHALVLSLLHVCVWYGSADGQVPTFGGSRAATSARPSPRGLSTSRPAGLRPSWRDTRGFRLDCSRTALLHGERRSTREDVTSID